MNEAFKEVVHGHGLFSLQQFGCLTNKHYHVLSGLTGMHGLVLDGLDIASDLGGLVLVLETESLVLDNLLLLAGQLLWWHGGISLCVSSERMGRCEVYRRE